MINPQWLRSFSTLAALGSFTGTADRLGLSQAAVSQHVRQLEDLFGRLLIRRPRRIELTPAGEALRAYCQEVAQADARLALRLADRDAQSGEVSLITPGSVGLFLYPALLDWQREHPGLCIRHRFAPEKEVLEAVLNSQYELGLTTYRPDDPRLTAAPFTEEALELIVPAAALAESWEDLERLGFIDHPDGQAMATRLLSLQFPGKPGIRGVPCHGFSNQVALILEPVARGLGFTVLPRYARKAFTKPELIRVVPSRVRVVDTLWLIHRAEWPLPARTQRAVAHMRACVGGGLNAG